jgi:hypothetical protein
MKNILVSMMAPLDLEADHLNRGSKGILMVHLSSIYVQWTLFHGIQFLLEHFLPLMDGS